MAIMRGETPDFTLELDADLTGMKVYVRISQGKNVIDLSDSRLEIVPGEGMSVITFRLNQNETLSLRDGVAEIQVHYIGEDGTAPLTDIYYLTVKRSLWDEVISFD